MPDFKRPQLIRLLKAAALLLDNSRTWMTGVEIMLEIGAIGPEVVSLGDADRRTFERLKTDLRNLGLELELKQDETRSVWGDGGARETTTASYRLARREVVLRNLSLTEQEATVLSHLREVLAQEEGFPLRADLGQALQKLAAVSPRIFAGTEENPVAPSPQPVPPRQEVSLLDQLIGAAAERHPVSFEYTAFHSDSTRVRDVDPYGFFTRRGIWYLVGSEGDTVRVFRVSRMTKNSSFRIHREKQFHRPEDFDVQDYANVPPWNFLQENPVREVLVQIDGDEYWRMDEYCERFGAAETNPDGDVFWRVPVRDPDALIKWLLPFGSAATPVAPPDFVSRYSEIVRETLLHYEN